MSPGGPVVDMAHMLPVYCLTSGPVNFSPVWHRSAIRPIHNKLMVNFLGQIWPSTHLTSGVKTCETEIFRRGCLNWKNGDYGGVKGNVEAARLD